MWKLDNRDLKHKLRELKRTEIAIRTQNFIPAEEINLVWNKFFSTKSQCNSKVRYPLDILVVFGHNARKEVFKEFFYHMYYEIFEFIGYNLDNIYDPDLLSLLGLHSNASQADIKKRFRELAKKYHPDCGGDKDKMIELLELYDKLLNK